jgi:hypothetical protein
MTARLLVYRCTKCGKWSHAQRNPKRHCRFERDEGQEAPAEVISYEPPTYDHLNGFSDTGGWYVYCGPFDTYEVRKVAL